MSRQYVQAEFTKNGRAYTYHNDGAPAKPGDKVEVATDRGKQTITVVSVSTDAPRFVTKPIIRIVPPQPPEAA